MNYKAVISEIETEEGTKYIAYFPEIPDVYGSGEDGFEAWKSLVYEARDIIISMEEERNTSI